jgi:hypothetical protein
MARNARKVATFSTVVAAHIESLHREFKNARSTRIDYVVDSLGDEGFDVTYHATTVARVRYEGDRVISVVLNSSGFHTPTTKSRMNEIMQAVGLPVRVYQQDHAWFLSRFPARGEPMSWPHPQHVIEFRDGVDAARVFGTLV